MPRKTSEERFGQRVFILVSASLLTLLVLVAAIFTLKGNPQNADPRAIVAMIAAIGIGWATTVGLRYLENSHRNAEKTPRGADELMIETHERRSNVQITIVGWSVVFILTTLIAFWGIFRGMVLIEHMEEVRRTNIIKPIEEDSESYITRLENLSQDSDFEQFLNRREPSPEHLKAASTAQEKYRDVLDILTKLDAMKNQLARLESPPMSLIDRLDYLSGIALDLTDQSDLAEVQLLQVSKSNHQLWPMSQIVLAKAYLRQGYADKCLETLTVLRQGYPTNSTAMYLLGVRHFREKQFKEAAIAFQECQGLDTDHFVFGDPRVQDDYATVSRALSLKLSGDDSKQSPLSELKNQFASAIDRGRLRVQTLGDGRRYRFLIDALSTWQFVYDEPVSMEEYHLLEAKLTDPVHRVPLWESERIAVINELLICIKETMQLLSQSPAIYKTYGEREAELLAVFYKVLRSIPPSLETSGCELEVQNSLASIRCHDLLLNAKAADAHERYDKLVQAEDSVSQAILAVQGKGGKAAARLTLGYQGVRTLLVGKALSRLDLIEKGNSILQKVIDDESKDPALPKDSPYLQIFRRKLDSSKSASSTKTIPR